MRFRLAAFIFAVLAASAARAATLQGDVEVHDPSTIVQCDGRYWVFATGAGISVRSSADGYTWRQEAPVFEEIPAALKAAVPDNSGTDVWAPDIARINGEYYLYYAVSTWGSSVSAIGLATNPTLNREDPKYKWTDRGVIVASGPDRTRNCIDPCVLVSPDGTLWLSYGSYYGAVEVLQLDPKTGLRISPDSRQYRLSSASEASAVIYHGPYYYLLVNRGSCCRGMASSYNIRVGRSAKVSGPYLDRYGVDMAHGGGDLFLGSAGNKVGPGHFGLFTLDGLERFSCHYEADGDHQRRSALNTLPLLWIDGWPVAGNDPPGGMCQLFCKRTGEVVQVAGLSVDGTLVRQGGYITADSQKWVLKPLGTDHYKIVGSRSGKALEAGGPGLHIANLSGSANQDWVIQQVSDGGYRVVCSGDGLALTGLSDRGRGLELAAYRNDDSQKWLFPGP